MQQDLNEAWQIIYQDPKDFEKCYGFFFLHRWLLLADSGNSSCVQNESSALLHSHMSEELTVCCS